MHSFHLAGCRGTQTTVLNVYVSSFGKIIVCGSTSAVVKLLTHFVFIDSVNFTFQYLYLPQSILTQDWDKPEYVPDPDAKKPDDWDDDTDGEWEPPMIPNPEYQGEWKPKQIDNPDYKGEWEHPQIPNPEYEEDANLYLYEDFGHIGIDIWQVGKQ